MSQSLNSFVGELGLIIAAKYLTIFINILSGVKIRKGKEMNFRLFTVLLCVIVLVLAMLPASCGPTEVPVPETRVNKPPEPVPAAPSAQGEWVVLPRPTPEGGKIMKWDEPPQMVIDASREYRAIIETEKGNLVLELFAKDVPRTVNNFVFLATQGFYDGSTFHRVLPGFMVQGGDPTGTGAGNPGYRFEDEFTDHSHTAGALSMANAGADTNGCQFFITFTPQPGLDGKHTVFGQLVEGTDVLEKLTPRNPSNNPQFAGDRIIRIVIEVR